VRAGHPVPILVGNEAGQAVLGDEGDLPVALFADATYSNITLQMQPGARLCLYSDGITECEAPNGDFFGEQRLQEFLKCHQSAPITHLGERFADEIRRWHGRAGEPFRDDVSLLVFEYQPGRLSDPRPI
jgi:sigma-B regulation protein RsbU (phosphoserine phosphatase)